MYLNISISRVATSCKSPGFFCCPGKVLENIWEVSRTSLRQNSKATFFNNKHKKLGTGESEF